MNNFLRQKRKRNRIVVAAAVVAVAVAVAVAVIARRYKKIGQGKETRKFREPMETRTDYNYISLQHNTPLKSTSRHPQQHSPSHKLEETLAVLRAISPGDS
ncbi:MAG: hypothetical protein EZS28_030468 [Streblomastix strix]|uniref:Uncharacterized protein n=1 Tax=Streblomastix strix TaxID=222440 RepID=A0A5J4UW47_9EUKA|nr:MAG: hypothetical protein EZS28_030468 [Streblomastix strix]